MRMGISLGFILLFGGFSLLVWLIGRRVARTMARSLKARQDLAMAVSDLNDRLARIEAKLENRDQKP